MAKHRILLADDEAGIRFGIRDFLETRGFGVAEADTGSAAVELARREVPDVAIVDYRLPDMTGLDVLEQLRAIDTELPVIMLTAYGSIDLAVRAIKEGAEQFLTKPVDLTVLAVLVERVLEKARSHRERTAHSSRQARDEIDPFVGASPAVRELEEIVRRVSATERPAVLQGETGSGKGVLATWIHANGPRSGDTLVDINCAGLSKELLESELFGHEKGAFTGAVARKAGLLEVAHRGTLFLDEIGDIDMAVQPKLLKVLEEQRFRRLGAVEDRTVDVRLIAATHHDLAERVREQRFRSDLFFRISTMAIRVPPLRERTEDIPLLAHRLLERLAVELGGPSIDLTTDAVAALQRYRWPGNIRELRNVLERAVLLSSSRTLDARDLRFDFTSSLEESLPEEASDLTLKELERRHIERVLREESGRVEPAAERLGIPRSTLYAKLKRYGLGTGASGR